MQKITPFLWFDDKAEEAMNFYLAISRIRRPEIFIGTVIAPGAAAR
jgi:predicted 3-demethylubiquinone-9 3-methyltransferase (glyoxalase superfamily)